MHPDLAGRLNGHDPGAPVVEAYRPPQSDDDLAGMILADVATLLPDDYLVKVDRASMAWGLEARPPLLDHELLELSAQIPSRWKVHRGTTKWVLKEAFRSTLPSSVLTRPKQGFEVPLDAWFRGPLGPRFDEVVLGKGRVAGLIDQAVAGDLYRRHKVGGTNQGAALWSMLVLASWADRYL
jgi:asparagine synthase (glutamine-hydrolysing)